MKYTSVTSKTDMTGPRGEGGERGRVKIYKETENMSMLKLAWKY